MNATAATNATDRDFDAVVVGASLGGCTAATLLGRAGARVALVERSPDPRAFKRICSHFVQSSAVPTLQRLGMIEPMEERGATRSRVRMWTRWGWIEPSPSAKVPVSINLRREYFDPMMRELAAATPGVELMLGATVDGLLREGSQVRGVQTSDKTGRQTAIRARLVVGADGRDSRVAALATLPVKTWAHGRFAYGGYFEGPGPEGSPDTTMWFLDPQWVAAFPTDGDLTFYAAMLTKDRLPAFRRDPTVALRALIADLPEAPPIRESRLVGQVMGKLDMPNVRRGPVGEGLALVGDAALATDPLWGVGCGWALQSAEWLADSVAPALTGEEPLSQGLSRYRRRFRRGLGAHAFMIHDYASGRRTTPAERMLFSAGVHEPQLAELFEAYGTRNISPARFLAKGTPLALRVHARRALASTLPGRSRRARLSEAT